MNKNKGEEYRNYVSWLCILGTRILNLENVFYFSFIVSFSFNAGNPENDGKRIQDFFLTTEAAIRDHPLWAGSTDEEIDNALEVSILYLQMIFFIVLLVY